jgi:hypothetical protein
MQALNRPAVLKFFLNSQAGKLSQLAGKLWVIVCAILACQASRALQAKADKLACMLLQPAWQSGHF